MAKIYTPLMNPIRFRRFDKTIDGNDVPYRFDYSTQRIEYQKGIYPVENYYVDWKLNKTIYFQIRFATNAPLYIRVYKPDGSHNDYAPTTQLISGARIYFFNYTPTVVGNHQIKIYDASAGVYADYDLISDIINVHDDNLIKLNYFDTQNRYGGYFFSDASTQLWNPTAYYPGQLIPGEPENDETIYNNDNGNIIKTRSETRRTAQLLITDINNLYVDVINQQLQCDNIYIYDVKYVADTPTVEFQDNSDICDINIKLTQQNNNYFMKLD